jgi:hypothetical protein
MKKMTNAKMTNDEWQKKRGNARASFVIRHSEIRHF